MAPSGPPVASPRRRLIQRITILVLTVGLWILVLRGLWPGRWFGDSEAVPVPVLAITAVLFTVGAADVIRDWIRESTIRRRRGSTPDY